MSQIQNYLLGVWHLIVQFLQKWKKLIMRPRETTTMENGSVKKEALCIMVLHVVRSKQARIVLPMEG